MPTPFRTLTRTVYVTPDGWEHRSEIEAAAHEVKSLTAQWSGNIYNDRDKLATKLIDALYTWKGLGGQQVYLEALANGRAIDDPSPLREPDDLDATFEPDEGHL